MTTILERTETNTMETLERVRKSKADLGPPPVHARLRVQHKAPSVTGSDSETSQYSHDPLGTDMDLTEDELAPVMVDRSMRKALIESDHLQSARLVESVQTRESEFVTRREQEIRERIAAHKQNTGFDVTVRTIEGRDNPMFSDDDTASMSEYMSQGPIEPVLIDRRGYSQHQDVSQMSSQFAHTSVSNRQQVSKFDVLIRVLDAPPPGASGTGSDKDDLTSVFSEDDKQRWRDIVTYDTEFRTMLESAQTTEEVTHAVSQVQMIF